jgi:hypothetical protein
MNHTCLNDPLRDLAMTIVDEPAPVHPALRARAEIAAIGSTPVTRPHCAPNYASDLGLRRSPDPSTFLSLACHPLGIGPSRAEERGPIDVMVDGWTSGDIHDTDLAGVLDRMISFGGQWNSAAELGRALLESPRRPEGYRLLTYLAAALSAAGDPRAGTCFQWASDASDGGAVGHAMSWVRRAAWSLKRQGQPRDALSDLRYLHGSVAELVRDRRLSVGDAAAVQGVALNLEALALSRAGDDDGAAHCLDRAHTRLSDGRLVMMGDDERRRYLVQVKVNQAQLLALRGSLSDACARMTDTLRWTRRHHEPSLSEVLALCGYLLYRSEHPADAVAHLVEAERLTAAEGTPGRLLMTRKMLAASLARTGAEASAAAVIDRATSDPAGLGAPPEGDDDAC